MLKIEDPKNRGVISEADLSRRKKFFRLARRLLIILVLLAVISIGAVPSILIQPTRAQAQPQAQAGTDIFPSVQKSLAQQAAEQKQAPPGGQLAQPPGQEVYQDGFWAAAFKELFNAIQYVAELFLGVLQWLTGHISRPLAEFFSKTVMKCMYNPNIAAGEPAALALPLITITNLNRLIAMDVLLLLFILAIWRYWVNAAYKGGSLMGAVGRLIATAALIVAWASISDFLIHISNDMIAQIAFNESDKNNLDQAFNKVISGVLLGLTLSQVGGPLGTMVIFAILSVLFYETLYLVVLKSIQVALLAAQYMFHPIFLVFFATPETERIATGFVKSCVEVSLWTYVWIGMVRILVMVLNAHLDFWSSTIMVIGVLQLMMSVPAFMAKAQISPISEFVSGAVIGKSAFAAAKKYGAYLSPEKGLLQKAFGALFGVGDSNKATLGGMSEKTEQKFNSLRDAAKASGTGPGGTPGAGPTGPGTTPPGTTPPGTTPPGTTPPGTTPPGTTPPGTTPPGTTPPGTTPPGTTPPGTTPPGTTPPGTTPPGTTPPGTTGPAVAGPMPPRRKPISDAQGGKHQRGSLLDRAINNFFDKFNRGGVEFGESDTGDDEIAVDSTNPRNGVSGINFARGAAEEEKARTIMEAALAHYALTNPKERDTAEKAASRRHPLLYRGRNTSEQGKLDWNRAVGEAAVSGARSYMNREAGNAVGGMLMDQFGELDSEKEAQWMHALTDDTLPQSPWNANYKDNCRTVDRAGLPRDAGPMSLAQQAGMSRLSGPEFNAAYQAVAASARANSANNGIGGLAPGTTAHTAALGRAISGMNPDRRRTAAAVGVELMGEAAAAQYTDQEIEAWVAHAQELVIRGGARDGVAAAAALHGAQTAQPAAFGNPNDPPATRLNDLNHALSHAVAGAMALKQSGMRPDFMSNAHLAGQVFELARRNEATPQKMQALRIAAEARGMDTFTSDDRLDAEVLMTIHNYSATEARNALIYAQTLREVDAGGPQGSATHDPVRYAELLASPTRGLPDKTVVQGVQDMGFGPTAAAYETARRSELAGMRRGQAMIAGRHIVLGALETIGYSDPMVDGTQTAYIASHQTELSEAIRGMEHARVVELMGGNSNSSVFNSPAVMAVSNLSGDRLQVVQELAENMVTHNLATSQNVPATEIPRSQIVRGLRHMPATTRATVIAMANQGNPAVLALRDQALEDYVVQIDDIAAMTGSQENPVQTLNYVQSAMGAVDANAVNTLNAVLHNLHDNIHLHSFQTRNPAVIRACRGLPSFALDSPWCHDYTRRAIQLYGADVQTHHVASLYDMVNTAHQFARPNLIGLEDVARYEGRIP